MTSTTDIEKNLSSLNKIPVVPKKVTLYRFKRVFFPLFIGFLTTFITFETGYCPALGFLAFITSGLFLDWWYFQYRNYKDSEQVSEELCQSIDITRNQIDELNQYMVTARKASLAASISVTAASSLFSDAFNWQATLILSYAGMVSFIVIFGMIAKKIIAPYALDKATGNQATPSYSLHPAVYPSHNESLYSKTENFALNINSFHVSNDINFLNSAAPKDSCNPYDATSSAAYSYGGVLDPSRYN